MKGPQTSEELGTGNKADCFPDSLGSNRRTHEQESQSSKSVLESGKRAHDQGFSQAVKTGSETSSIKGSGGSGLLRGAGHLNVRKGLNNFIT